MHRADPLADLAPTTSATSAWPSAMLRAALAHSGESSGTTPRPMAVARKGSLAASASCRSCPSACA